jgi:succinyl-diaminopimelate desuccinylase
MTDTIELTKHLVRIKSCDPGEFEGEIGDFIFKRLAERGLTVRKQEVFSGRYNIIAEIKSESELPPLVILCHMDTVVVGDGWTEDPFAADEKNGLIFGRGACDMKSGLACGISVLEELWESGKKSERTLYFIATVDEEAEMSGIQAILRENFLPKDSLLMDLEPTSLSVATSHKGRIWFRVNVRGVTAHASTPWKGIDAIAAAAHFISIIHDLIYLMPEHAEMGSNTVTFGMIDGGYQPYVVPDYCTMTMDVRTVSPYTEQDISELMNRAKDLVDIKFPGIKISWELTGNRPYVCGNPKLNLCTEICNAYREVCGQEAHIELFPGYTDSAVAAAALGSENFVSFGPGSLEKAHKPDEYVKTDEINRCKMVLKNAVNRLCFPE